jgi:hypothetical protein
MPNLEFDPLATAPFTSRRLRVEIGNKRIFEIEPGELVFNNVFAWEGAIAVAKAGDKGRVDHVRCKPGRRHF